LAARLRILVVDDNEDEIVLLRTAFKMSRLPFTLHHVKDGLDCMAFLHKDAPWTDVPTPDLILLDLNMPRMNGAQVMAAITEDAKLRELPMIVFSTSSTPDEIAQMYRLGCTSFIVKPVAFDRLMEVVRSLVNYWFTVAALPGEPTTRKEQLSLALHDRLMT
jgi:two-component system, chemotaxis family, response regulator Rcp1